MAYFTGKSLDRKIEEFDLKELDKKLEAIVRGEENWPGQSALLIPSPAEHLESLRIVVYSLLHRYSLKDDFVVKVVPALQAVEVALKAKARRTGLGMTFVSDSGEKKPTIEVEATDMSGIFEE